MKPETEQGCCRPIAHPGVPPWREPARSPAEPPRESLSPTEPFLRQSLPGVRILLVEDEGPLLRLGQKMLQRLGHEVLAVRSPGEALKIATTHDAVLHLLVTDIVLPEMSGASLYEEVRRHRPEIRCIFMSGYTSEILGESGESAPRVPFLQKPYSLQQLAEKLQEVLED